MKNIIRIATFLLVTCLSFTTLAKQENKLPAHELNKEDIYVILTTSPETANGGISLYEYKNDKGDYTKTFYIIDKQRNIYEQLTHFRIPEKNLAPGVKFERDVHWMDVKRLSTSKAKYAIDIDSLYPTWTRKTAKAFMRKLNKSRVWVIDRSEPRNNNSSVIITQADPIVGGH